MKYIIAILIFCGIIMFHEYGHFLLAKLNNIQVNEFCLGLGPTIAGFKKGETKFSIKLFPIGGACIMEGEDGESKNPRAFPNKSILARLSVIAAGPIFNFILAFLLSLIIIGGYGYDLPVVGAVSPGYGAEEAGIEPGDIIVKIDHQNIHFYREISTYLMFHPNVEEIEITYERNNQRYTVEVPIRYSEEAGRYLMGVSGYGTITQTKNPFTIMKYSGYTVEYWIRTTIQSLRMLVTGQVSVDQMSGPVGIVKTIGDTYDASMTSGAFIVFINMINIAVLLTANLGVMNLIPIPALDGGRILFLIIEAIRRKKMDVNKEGITNFIFFVILIVFMFFIMFKDIERIIVQ